MAAMEPERLPGLQFILLAGAPAQPGPEACGLRRELRSAVPSLHVMSDHDELVPLASSRSVADRFIGSELFQHDKGHAMPCRASDVDKYLGFMERVLNGHDAATSQVGNTVLTLRQEARQMPLPSVTPSSGVPLAQLVLQHEQSEHAPPQGTAEEECCAKTTHDAAAGSMPVCLIGPALLPLDVAALSLGHDASGCLLYTSPSPRD